MKSFKGRDIISIRDFSQEEIDYIITVSEKIQRMKDKHTILRDKILASLFFEPSTRTRLSFESAMNRLGGRIIGFSSSKSTSISKGESVADTIRVVSNYADAIVLRHPNEGAARLSAEYADVPVINAGDGAGQHPTQTLLDLYTIKIEKGNIGNNTITLVGDLKYGRTVHSLTLALGLFKPKLNFVSPPELKMPEEILSYLDKNKIEYTETKNLDDVISETDVLYVTRIQKERFPDMTEYARVAGTYRITKDILMHVKDSLIIMHPLPRIDEIASEVDSTKYAVYFKQAYNGLVVRMGLLALVMGGIE